MRESARALDAELRVRGGVGLSRAQRDALELACSGVQLTIIEGQAGTGKSTVLIGVARAHQAGGREVIVTSTGALAAQRLAAELQAPEHGPLRHGTAARVTKVDTDRHALVLRLDGGDEVRLDREQIDRAGLRLAYVQHPFPAQGQTSDTAHLIVAEHTTKAGSYVAITRARETTHIHAARPEHPDDARDPIAELADHMSRSEPDVPSIDIPPAHEYSITRLHEQQAHASDRSEPQRRLAEQPAPAQREHVVAMLGPTPDPEHPDRETGDRGVAAIESYRARYEIPVDQWTGSFPKHGGAQQATERDVPFEGGVR